MEEKTSGEKSAARLLDTCVKAAVKVYGAFSWHYLVKTEWPCRRYRRNCRHALLQYCEYQKCANPYNLHHGGKFVYQTQYRYRRERVVRVSFRIQSINLHTRTKVVNVFPSSSCYIRFLGVVTFSTFFHVPWKRIVRNFIYSVAGRRRERKDETYI